MVDLSHAKNPYDFAHPVPDARQFVGRRAELEDIRYYLDQCKVTPHPISLALLGPRASGKTSVLNVVEAEAKARGYLPVRIDLNEGDVQSDFAFFFKFFDAVVMAVFLSGAFGGTAGKTYDTYLDMIYADQIPEDKTFSPFLLPLQYAKAKGRASAIRSVSDSSLRHDLDLIHQQLKVPLILLFDECNVLARSRVILEKLRNLFMNMLGYMLVLTGTPDLFPVIDEVFSPIVRQFKKIPIGAFSNWVETDECIRRPLEELGAQSLIEGPEIVSEIQELTGGRPYEVKLVCHFLFRRIQEGKASKMNLDTGVLEAIKRELETSQDVLARPTLEKIRRLEPCELAELALLCPCDGGATFEDAWAINYIFQLLDVGSREETNAARESFLASGLLIERAGKLTFAGDEFDKIYTRYYAKERGVAIFRAQSVLEWISDAIRRFAKRYKDMNIVAGEASISDTNEFETVARKLNGETIGDVSGSHQYWKYQLYVDMNHYVSGAQIPVLCIDTGIPSFLARSWIYPAKPLALEAMSSVEESVTSCSNRAIEVGYPLSFHRFLIDVPPMTTRAKAVADAPDKTLVPLLWTGHWVGIFSAYMAGNIALAREHRDAAQILDAYTPEEFGATVEVNSGYLSFALGYSDIAEQTFRRSLEGAHAALAHYNLAMVLISEERLQESQEHLRSAIELCDSPVAKDPCMCLFFPQQIEDRLTVIEEMGQIDLRDFAVRSEAIVTLFLESRRSAPLSDAGANLD